MNQISNAAFAVIAQAAAFFALAPFNIPGWWIGAAFSIGWYVSREYAQREAELIRYGRKFSRFEPFRGWTLERYLDAIVPTVVVLALGAIYQWRLG